MMVKKKKGPTPKKIHVKMAVIPGPSDTKATILTGDDFPKGEPVFQWAKSRVCLDCGNCGRTLVKVPATTNFRNMEVQCPECRMFNETLE